jgi:hypothetical protein
MLPIISRGFCATLCNYRPSSVHFMFFNPENLEQKRLFEQLVVFTLIKEFSVVVAMKIVILSKIIWQSMYPSLRHLHLLHAFRTSFSKTNFNITPKF